MLFNSEEPHLKYLGSKARIASQILPIMLAEADKHGIETWYEPFVGGGNMIDKVPARFARIGSDVNPHTIYALRDIRDRATELPEDFTEAEYRAVQFKAEPGPVNSLARFVASFSGKFAAGFARGDKPDGTPRNYWKEARRNAIKQQPGLQGVLLAEAPYRDLSLVVGALIYCDPPYEGTTSYKTGGFDHAAFWQWCRDMAHGNLVFVSEYSAPTDFECVWSGEVRNNVASTFTTAKFATEKLFKAPTCNLVALP